MNNTIPRHLKKYVVKQSLEHYTAQDHAVWRFSMRQLKNFLTKNAHHSYLDGLVKTGITTNEIPSIDSIDKKLNQFGWKAIPVSGFIPPTAFMEFQSLGYLPIASGIRSIETILYTPAPDIIHEAAGHAPIISDADFSQYLKNYASIASKAILNKSDIDLYDAIRELSDLKEHPNSTPEQITTSEAQLETVSKNMGPPSEAALLGRMNWWTAEYGLIGTIDSQKIFGAGLLSSIGESENCLKSNIKKLPLTADCINYSYDITEQQPQLFVTPSFEHLTKVLNDFSETMCFKIGGSNSVKKAIHSKTINSLELNSGIQISGIIEKQIINDNKTIFVKTSGPTQLSFKNKQVKNHNKEFHSSGYSTIIDTINGICLSQLQTNELDELGLKAKNNINLNFDSGFSLKGIVEEITLINSFPKIIKFSNCEVQYKSSIYFQPEWGDFDLAIGSNITSVFGGPADTESYGELYNFTAQVIPPITHSLDKKKLFDLYSKVRKCREQNKHGKLDELTHEFLSHYPDEWLIGIELLELIEINENENPLKEQLISALIKAKNKSEEVAKCIEKGINLSKM